LKRQYQPTLDDYKRMLKDQWTRPVACQDQCDPPGSCSCQNHIIHVDALKAWCTHQPAGIVGRTRLHQLFDEMQNAEHRTFPLDFRTYFEGDQGCLRVFSQLLGMGYGHLIDQFYKSNMHDIYLERGGDFKRLRENLLSVIPNSDEVDQIVKNFELTRWAYCPLTLKLHLDRGLEATKVVVPFCRKIKLGDKGATASVYWVAVQQDLISDERLREALHESLHEDPDYGKVSSLGDPDFCSSNVSLSVTRWP